MSINIKKNSTLGDGIVFKALQGHLWFGNGITDTQIRILFSVSGLSNLPISARKHWSIGTHQQMKVM